MLCFACSRSAFFAEAGRATGGWVRSRRAHAPGTGTPLVPSASHCCSHCSSSSPPTPASSFDVILASSLLMVCCGDSWQHDRGPQRARVVLCATLGGTECCYFFALVAFLGEDHGPHSARSLRLRERGGGGSHTKKHPFFMTSYGPSLKPFKRRSRQGRAALRDDDEIDTWRTRAGWRVRVNYERCRLRCCCWMSYFAPLPLVPSSRPPPPLSPMN